MTPTANSADIRERLDAIVALHRDHEGPLLPILHDIQAEWGYIPQEAQPVIAAALGLTRAEVHGVVSFYHDFREAPAGRHVLRLCRAEACQSMGADALADQLRAALGCLPDMAQQMCSASMLSLAIRMYSIRQAPLSSMVAHAARGMEPFSSLLENAVFRHWCCLPHAEAHSRAATRGGYDRGGARGAFRHQQTHRSAIIWRRSGTPVL